MISACTFGITAVAMVMVPLGDRRIVPRGILRGCAKLHNAQSFFEDACVRLLLKLRATPAQPASRDPLRIGAAKKEAGRAFGFIKARQRAA
jgi:hypothetical protein